MDPRIPTAFIQDLTMAKVPALKIVSETRCKIAAIPTITRFFVVQYRESGNMTVELIDTESGESRCSEGEEGVDGGGGAGRVSDHPDAAYLERFLAPPYGSSLSLETRRRLAQRPVFLCRSVTSYRRRVRHRIVPRPKQEERCVFYHRCYIIQFCGSEMSIPDPKQQ
jgi:hypothetical protein